MTRAVPAGEVRPLGDRAFLIGVDDPAAARAVARAVEAELPEAELEAVCGYATVLVRPAGPDLAAGPDVESLPAALAGVTARAGGAVAVGGRATTPTPGRLVDIPCTFDGPDLDEVAEHAGLTRGDVVAQLTAVTLDVAVVGFSPGFAYLEGLPEPLRRVPRRARPRPVVPAGSVALANGHAAVYPTSSPGGWHLVGRTGVPLFSPDAPPYAALAPGDRVRFRRAGADDPVGVPAPARPPWSPPAGARPVLELVTPGLRAVLQDAGRRRVAAVGVPAAGPADPESFALATLLVAGAPGDAALELTGGGTRLRAVAPCHVAVVGAAPVVRVDGRPAPHDQVLPLTAGQEIQVGPLRGGCRTYLAVAGGFLGAAVMGSRSSDELTRLGAGPLDAGAVLHAGDWEPPLGDHLAPGSAPELTAADRPVRLRVVPGPHAELFSDDALARLAGAVFEVTPESNRIGLRLRPEGGPPAPVRPGALAGGLDSHGVVTGVVQLPPGGEPVVLLPDHATLGGYPVLAVVATADHGLLGQCAPGTRVRVEPVELAEAREADRSARRARARAVVGHFPLAVH